jgi:hypothetical protein
LAFLGFGWLNCCARIAIPRARSIFRSHRIKQASAYRVVLGIVLVAGRSATQHTRVSQQVGA